MLPMGHACCTTYCTFSLCVSDKPFRYYYRRSRYPNNCCTFSFGSTLHSTHRGILPCLACGTTKNTYQNYAVIIKNLLVRAPQPLLRRAQEIHRESVVVHIDKTKHDKKSIIQHPQKRLSSTRNKYYSRLLAAFAFCLVLLVSVLTTEYSVIILGLCCSSFLFVLDHRTFPSPFSKILKAATRNGNRCWT